MKIQNNNNVSFGIKIDPLLEGTVLKVAKERGRLKNANKKIITLSALAGDDFCLTSSLYVKPSNKLTDSISFLRLHLKKNDVTEKLSNVIVESTAPEYLEKETYRMFMALDDKNILDTIPKINKYL